MTRVYELEFTKTFEDTFKSLKEDYRRRIMVGLEKLKTNPNIGKRIINTGKVKLNLRRIKVGHYRIFYVVEESFVKVLLIALDLRGDNTYRRKEINRIITAYLRHKQNISSTSS